MTRDLRIGTLQWIIGTFCAVIGALLVVSPHQFAQSAYAALRPHMPLWGAFFLLGGLGLLAVAALSLRRSVAVIAHLVAATALASLSGGFIATGHLPGISNYAIFGAGTALAPLLLRRWGRFSSAGPDLFGVVLGLAVSMNGFYLAFMPDQFQAPIFDRVRPFLSTYGLVFMTGGLGLIVAQLRPGLPRPLILCVHLLLAGGLLVYCWNGPLPFGSWTGSAYYGGFGVVIALLPWLAPRIRRVDPQSLRMQFGLALSAAGVLPLIVMMGLVTDREERSVVARELSFQQGLARGLAENIADELGLQQAIVTALGSQPGLPSLAPAAKQELLDTRGRAYDGVLTFGIVDAEGNLVASSDGFAEKVGPGVSPELSAAADGLSLTIYQGPVSGPPLLIFRAPMVEQDGRPAGLVLAVSESQRLADLLSRATIGPGGSVYVVDGDGRLILHPDPAKANLADLSGRAPVVALLHEGHVSGSLRYTERVEQFAGYAGVPDRGWGVVVERPAAAALANVRAARDLASGVLLVIIAVAAGAGLLTARRLAAPLAVLTQAVEKLAAGDAAAPLPQSHISEVATLADAFGEMRDRLEARTAEQLRAEQALRESEERLESILGSLDEVVWSASVPNHEKLYVSAAVQKIYGVSREQFFDDRDLCIDVIHPDDRELVRKARADLVTVGSKELEYRIIRPDGEVRWIHDRRRLVQGPGDSPVRVDGIAADITERKALAAEVARLEARREMNRLKSEFVSIASHEFRTPLASLVGFTELLLLDEVDEAQRREWTETMHLDAVRLSNLVEELLDVSKIEEGGQLQVRCEPVNVRTVIADVLAKLQFRASGHRLEQAIDEGVPSVLADSEKLEQVLVNLVSNAIKYSPGGGMVRVSAEVEDGFVKLSVADQGLGLPHNEIPHLFGRFHRIQDAQREGIEGTGLGLYITKRLIDLLDGRIWAESAGPGQGSTFHVALPVASGGAADGPLSRPAVVHGPAGVNGHAGAVGHITPMEELQSA